MAAKPVVLLAGITGMMGDKIASAILDKGEMDLKAIVRPNSSSNGSKQQRLDEFKARGVVLVEGDLLDKPSLLKACEGVEAIVSAANASANDKIMVEGQTNLIEAAEAKGVKRMIPSDYSVDYRKLDWGDNYNLDLRQKVFNILEQSNLSYTLILNGCFTEILFSPYLQVFDFEAGTFNYWGDGETVFDTTTTDDTAKYVAEAIADPEMANAALKIAGDVISMKQTLATYQQVTGKKLDVKHLGSVADLESWIEQKQQTASSPNEYLPQQYIYTMVSGKGKFDRLQNSRYPQIQPQTVQQYLATANL